MKNQEILKNMKNTRKPQDSSIFGPPKSIFALLTQQINCVRSGFASPSAFLDLLRQQKGTDFWYRNKLVLLLILVFMVQANPSMSYCGNTGSVIIAFLINHYPEVQTIPEEEISSEA